MSKLDELLDYLDSGIDFDVEWSARDQNRVFMQYEDGSSILVTALFTPAPEVPNSGATS